MSVEFAFAQLETEFAFSQITFGSFNDANPVFSPDNQTIIFESNRLAKESLFRISMGDSIPNQIGDTSISLYTPAWHPDGKTIIAVNELGGKQSLAELGKSQKLKPLLKRQVQFNAPSFNPNGNLLAFAGKTPNDKYWKLMSYDFKYDNLNEIVKVAGDIFNPRWSKNGSYLSYHIRKAPPSTGTEIKIIQWNGSPYATISCDTMQYSQACWGPGLGKIAYIATDEKGYWLLSCKADGSNVKTIAFSINILANPDWSSDGKSIVLAIKDENMYQHLYIIHLDQYRE